MDYSKELPYHGIDFGQSSSLDARLDQKPEKITDAEIEAEMFYSVHGLSDTNYNDIERFRNYTRSGTEGGPISDEDLANLESEADYLY